MTRWWRDRPPQPFCQLHSASSITNGDSPNVAASSSASLPSSRGVLFRPQSLLAPAFNAQTLHAYA